MELFMVIYEEYVFRRVVVTRHINEGNKNQPNILLDQGWHVQLSDFGLACYEEDINLTGQTSHAWNMRWSAPELLDPPDSLGADEEPRPDGRSDIFSFGCLCIEVRFFIVCAFRTTNRVSPLVLHTKITV